MDFTNIPAVPTKLLLEGFQTRAPVPKSPPKWTVEELPKDKTLPDLDSENKYHIAKDMYERSQKSLKENDKAYVIKDQNGVVAGVITIETNGRHIGMIPGSNVGIGVSDNKIEVMDAGGKSTIDYNAKELHGINVVGPLVGTHAGVNISHKTGKEKLNLNLQRGRTVLTLGEKTMGVEAWVKDGMLLNDYDAAFPTDIQIHVPESVIRALTVDMVKPLSNDKDGYKEVGSGRIKFNYNDNVFGLSSIRLSNAEPLVYENKTYNVSLHTTTKQGEGTIPLFKNGDVVPKKPNELEKILGNTGKSPVPEQKSK